MWANCPQSAYPVMNKQMSSQYKRFSSISSTNVVHPLNGHWRRRWTDIAGEVEGVILSDGGLWLTRKETLEFMNKRNNQKTTYFSSGRIRHNDRRGCEQIEASISGRNKKQTESNSLIMETL